MAQQGRESCHTTPKAPWRHREIAMGRWRGKEEERKTGWLLSLAGERKIKRGKDASVVGSGVCMYLANFRVGSWVLN